MQYVENPDFLDAEAFEARFLAPGPRRCSGVKLAGVIAEQPYERARDSPAPDAFVAELDRFVRALPSGPPGAPGGVPLHLEIRSPHLLSPAYLDWLEGRRLGFCFSHWQWLPTLGDQWRLVGERFTSGTQEAVVRLMQPREMTFDESFRLAHPFDAPVPELSETGAARRMVDEAVALMYQRHRRGRDAARRRQQPRVGQHAGPRADARAPLSRLRRAPRGLTSASAHRGTPRRHPACSERDEARHRAACAPVPRPCPRYAAAGGKSE